MRVLHVLHSAHPDVTGASIRSRYVVETQRKLGIEPLVVSSPFQKPVDPAKAMDVEWVDGIRYFRCFEPRYDQRFMLAKKPLATRIRKLTAIFSFTRLVQRLAREHRVDVIHGHSLFFCGLAGAIAARALGIPSIYEVRSLIEDGLVQEGGTSTRNVLYRAYRAFDALTLRLATHVVTISEGLRSDLLDRGVDPERLSVIGNGVDVAAQPPAPPRDPSLLAELGLPGDAQVLGYIGTLFAYESLDLLIDAVASLAPTRPRLHAVVVGDGPAREALVERARAHGMTDRVHIVGARAHGEIGRYYGLVDLFVLPRRPNRLTNLVTPLKPLEIMARAKPLLASDCGGHRELIVHGENGFLFDSMATDGLAASITKTLFLGPTLAATGQRARAWVTANRSWDAAIRPTLEIYRALSERSPRTRVASGYTHA